MGVPEISVDEFADRHPQGVVVIDVRQPDEYQEGHVPGAVLIPLGEVPERVAEVPTDTPVYLVCRSGGRSRRAAEFLGSSGVDVINVDGGTAGWVEAGHPVVVGSDPR